MQGLVLKIEGQSTTVAADGGERYRCDLRGRLHHLKNRRLAVGDRVRLSVAEDGGAVIEAIEERRSALRRYREGKRPQVMCANIDRVIVVVAAADPIYKLAFIDRVLVSIEREGLEAGVVINKADLLVDAEHRGLVEDDLEVYRGLGYRAMLVSGARGDGLDELRGWFDARVSVVIGPSGVGKSTLLNAMVPGLEQRTGEVGRSRKGRHITSSAVLIPLGGGAFIADTPGLRAFGLEGIAPEGLERYFPELAALKGMCHFGDCSHRHEPHCGVIAAVDNGAVAGERYESYLRIREDLEESAAKRR